MDMGKDNERKREVSALRHVLVLVNVNVNVPEKNPRLIAPDQRAFILGARSRLRAGARSRYQAIQVFEEELLRETYYSFQFKTPFFHT